MKNIFIILSILSCVFISALEAVTPKKHVNKQLAAKDERQILLDNCWIIRSNIASKFSGMGSGALHSSGFKNAVKQEITNYLRSVGTSTALQLLKELEANGFKGFI